MILYKNVDICDLKSIMTKGILSIDESGNNNWDEEKRANNRTDVVYLFKPDRCASNSFPQYGVVLLEVACDATENKISDDDVNFNLYTEYVTKKGKGDCMIKYRPHRGGLDKSMAEMKIFNTIEEMFNAIVEEYHGWISFGDLIILEDIGKDKRIDWKETRYVCTKHCDKEIYDSPMVIGMCSIEKENKYSIYENYN